MSWTELMPGGPGLPPGLTLGDCLHRGLAPGACPGHQDDDPETETAA